MTNDEMEQLYRDAGTDAETDTYEFEGNRDWDFAGEET